jgi:hypothetical protein
MKTKFFTIGMMIVLLFAVTACGAVSSLKTVNSTGNEFMQALKDQQNDTSWNILAKSVQDQIGDQTAWAAFTKPRTFDSWKFSSNNVTNNQAQLDGEATLNGDTYTVTLVMDQSGDNWLISGINFTKK